MSVKRPTNDEIQALAEEMLVLMQGRALELAVMAGCLALIRIAKAQPVSREYISASLAASARSVDSVGRCFQLH